MGMKERCVRCGKETEYDVETPITVRRFFIEGAGQLCEECWRKLYDHDRNRKIDSENELHRS